MLKPAKSLLKASSAAITSGDIVMTRKLKRPSEEGQQQPELFKNLTLSE